MLVPSRELSLQTAAVLKGLGKHIKGLQVVSLMGGSPTRDDILRLKQGCHLVVATPGKLIDLAGKGAVDLSRCPLIALDEADKLLSDRMREETQELLNHFLPREHTARQLMLFSATFPAAIRDFIAAYMPGQHKPAQVRCVPPATRPPPRPTLRRPAASGAQDAAAPTQRSSRCASPAVLSPPCR